MTKSEYRQKLLDPRWQKKRLEILNRDDFQCQYCGDRDKTLHVHHKRYSNGEPWNIPASWLVTLCEVCHEHETMFLADACRDLVAVVRERFNADEVWRLADMFNQFCKVEQYGRHQLDEDMRLWLIPERYENDSEDAA